MTCKHHPEYDPASGEPTGGAKVITDSELRTWCRGPCPWCLQARMRWLGQLPAYPHEEMVVFKERIAELEKAVDLAKFGGHNWDCLAHPDEHGFLNNKECDCGFEEAKERWK